MIEDTLAKRYVIALIDSLDRDSYELVLKELSLVKDLLLSSEKLTMIFSSPRVIYAEKLAVLEELLKKIALSQITTGFLKVLIKNNRVSFLDKIITYYKNDIYADLGKVSVTVDVAVKISADMEKQILTVFQKYTGKDVDLKVEQDSSLLAGMIAHIDDNVIDASLSGQLKKIEKELINNN